MIQNPEQTVVKLIDTQGIAFLGATDENGYPNIKAMLPPRKREGIKTFYFPTNTSAQHVAQYRQNPKGCLYFCDRMFFRGVMLRGTVDVLEDAEIKESLWQDGDYQRYPRGVNDPDYCVLRFTIENGRFYNNSKSEDFPV